MLVQTGSGLILVECADEKAGTHSAGAARQYNGHLGKVGLYQVSVCLSYANITAGLWTLVDGELFLPEAIFAKENRNGAVSKASRQSASSRPKWSWVGR